MRYFDAFEAGTLSPKLCEERVAALETRLADLRPQEAELALPQEEGEREPTEADLQAVADRLERVLPDGEPQKTKALLRILIKELKVNGKSEILPTYRVVTPAVCATSGSVEEAGIEPAQGSYERLADAAQGASRSTSSAGRPEDWPARPAVSCLARRRRWRSPRP